MQFQMSWVRSWLMVIAAMMATAQAASASPAQPSFVVIGAPITPYVRAIVGGASTVDDLLNPGQDLHDISLSPSQMKLLSKADALILPDLGVSPALHLLTKKMPKLNIIELTKIEGAEPLPYLSENPWLDAVKAEAEKKDKKPAPTKEAAPKKPNPFDHRAHAHEEHDHHHEEGGLDPHLWLDPERMAAMAVPLAKVMSLAAPDYQKEYTLNAKTLATHLRADVMPGVRAALAERAPSANEDKPAIPFITAHPAYQYFIARFDLPYRGQISTGTEEFLGGKTVDMLLQAAATQPVRCIIAEGKTTLVSRLAKASGAKIVLVMPEQLPAPRALPLLPWIQNDYDRFLYGVATQFAPCL
jgi:zinc transport system substrate-binding protein